MSQTNVLFLFLLPVRSALLLPLNHPITHGGTPSHNELRGRGMRGCDDGGGGAALAACRLEAATHRTAFAPDLLCLPSCSLVCYHYPLRPPIATPILLPTPHPLTATAVQKGGGGRRRRSGDELQSELAAVSI